MTVTSAEGFAARGEPSFATDEVDGCFVLRLSGSWTTQTIRGQDTALAALRPNGAAQAVVDLAGIDALDTTGAWLVHRTARSLERAGLAVELKCIQDSHVGLIDTVADNGSFGGFTCGISGSG